MSGYSDLSIRKKLSVGFGVMLTALLVLGTFSLIQMANINKATEEITQKRMFEMRYLSSIRGDANATRSAELMWLLVSSREEISQSRQKLDSALQKLVQDMNQGQERFGAVATEEDRNAYKQFGEALQKCVGLHNQILSLRQAGKPEEARRLSIAQGPLMEAMLDAIEKATVQAYENADAAAQKAAHEYDRARDVSLGLLVLAIAVGIALTIVVPSSITVPLGAATAFLGRISQGDVSRDVQPGYLARKDEIGDLGRTTQAMTETLRKLVREISQGLQTVASSATQLTAASAGTASSVKSMAEKSATVAAAAEESCATTTAVSNSMERASANLTSVAGATEEMSSTVAEIASNSEKARAISDKAISQAQTISTIMAELGRAAQEIGKVTETITDISAQTNLLALNATIEAARAGTAGKGFAVVANEIKELAKQTSEATEDIKAKIAGVQNSTAGAVQTIETITGVIHEIGNTVAGTAAAIEEQATVTKNVAGDIAQATAIVREVNDQVAQTASVSRSIAGDIATVNDATAGIREGGEQVQTSASELSRLSEQLKSLVAQFSV
jgi:methyl-accepting chemotaxis protein